MAEKNIAKITSEVFALLEGLDADQRKRVISATMALFGEGVPSPAKPNKPGSSGDDGDVDLSANIGVKAKRWIKQYSVPMEAVNENFHFNDDGTVEIITAELPGQTKKEQTANAYLICGIRTLFETDEAKIDNTKAVEFCKHIGCYDKNNHSANRNSLGNKIAGSVSNGFSLPAPGLKAAAELVKSTVQ